MRNPWRRGSIGVRVCSVGEIVRAQQRVRGLALAFTVCATLTVVGPRSVPAQAAEPGPARLEAVQGQDLGTFDRVTFQFRADPPTLPIIRSADYLSRPVLADASGMEVPVDGGAVLRIAMSPATGASYTGPTRIQPGLPSVVDIVQVGDFEGVLSWAIGVRSGAATVTAQVLTDPTRVIVDVPHVVAPVVVAPSFTG